MRTKFKLLKTGDVELIFTNVWGTTFFETYTVNAPVGYVRTEAGKQVCDKLSCNGETLRSSRDGLLATIKREFRKLRIQDRREYDKI